MSGDTSSVDWNSGAKDAFGMYGTFNSFLGLWPLVRSDLLPKIRRGIIAFELIMMIVGVSYEFTHNCSDAEDFIDNLMAMSVGVISLSRIILYHVHRNKLTVNIVSSIEDWSSHETTKYHKVMASNARICKIFSVLYGIAVFSNVALHSFNVLFLSPNKFMEVPSDDEFKTNATQMVLIKRYPLPSVCTLNDVSDTVYLIIVFNQLIQAFSCCAIMTGSDILFFAITAHLCGQFEFLTFRFASLGSDPSRPETTMSRENIVALISRHQELLTRTELLEAAYNKIILIQLMLITSVCSAAGYGLVTSLKSRNMFIFVKSFILMQSTLLQSFLYTSIGDALQSASDNIMQSVYDGLWYELPGYLCKDIMFIMMRSKVSLCLTAGKFLYMTRTTFMKIVKITFSYISALQLMLDD